jgi:uncharacterized protein involved in exopolysaccharide biosynthesis
VIVPDSQGAGIINSEIQILTSLDLAEQAVDNIGAASILAKAGGGSNTLSAAGLVRAAWRRIRPARAAASSWSRSNTPTRKWFNPFFRKS